MKQEPRHAEDRSFGILLLYWVLIGVVCIFFRTPPRASGKISRIRILKIVVGFLSGALVFLGFFLEKIDFSYRIIAPQYYRAMQVYNALEKQTPLILREGDSGFKELEQIARKEFLTGEDTLYTPQRQNGKHSLKYAPSLTYRKLTNSAS